MTDHDDLDAWLDANAALLRIPIAPEWRDFRATACAHHA